MPVQHQHRLEKRLGYTFKSDSLLEEALTHRSVGSKNNERLEFIGDAIVNFIIGEALFHQFPEVKEGHLTQMRAQMVKGETLADIAREFALGDYLLLGPGELKSGGFRRTSILADVVEALIGAIYLEAGMDICRQCVLVWYKARLSSITLGQNKDFKTRLQEGLQALKKPLPKYSIVHTTGTEHQQHFKVQCEVGQQYFFGEGSNRRAAEQAAAALALEALQSKTHG